jgi:hypothetical protein
VKIPFSSRIRFHVRRDLRLDRFRDGSNLVDLKQETVASFFLNSNLDTKGVRDGEVVANNLDTTFGGEVSPSLPVILVEGILDGDDGVLLDVAEVEVGKFDTGEPLRRVGIGVLEVEVVLAILVELRGGNIKSDLDLSLITCLLDSLAEELKRLICARDVWGESSLITNIDGYVNARSGRSHVRI